tara:strand:+ start:1120 stop:1308 length:189 start_codon:yes stop_codon:yes gene_type:complete
LLFEEHQAAKFNGKTFSRGQAVKEVQFLINLPFIIVKASLKNDLAILVDLLVEDLLPKSENN